ncbi:MAG: helix-turn-helix domain-containing protein [Pseudomonadota bacterium]
MNFGEKLKQIRNEKNMTQPQLAEAIGIEQSYLSKLENDKSVPSAEMFQSIIKTLEMDAKDFLKDIDKNILNGALKQIPEVANFINVAVVTRVHNVKKWLIGSAAACAFGFALMLAANDGLLFSNFQYKYESQGVILNNESEDIFRQYHTILGMKEDAKIITHEELNKLLSEFETSRVRLVTIETWENKGTVFFQAEGNGRRKFQLIDTKYAHSLGNKILQFLGALFMFCGVAGFFIEWRLRKLQVH